MKDLLESSLSLFFGIIIFFGWIGGVPLAFIFGDKLDVVLSIFIPFYGLIIAILHFI